MNGSHLTLGLVGVLAAAGALGRHGSRSTSPSQIVRDAIRRVEGREPFDVIFHPAEGSERWTGEEVPQGAVLFLIHDGGDLSLYGDPEPRDTVIRDLRANGYKLVPFSSVYSYVLKAS